MVRCISVCTIFFLFICSWITPSIGGSFRGIIIAPEGDIPTWYQGDQWTYTIDPLYFSNPNGSFSGSVHNFKQKVIGITGDAYKVNITGQITGVITVNGIPGDLSGEITGTSYMRVSDLAEETTTLHSQGTVVVLIPFPYVMNIITNSTPPLEVFDFPLNIGEQWQLLCMSTTQGSFHIQGIIDQSLNGTQSIDETVQCTSKEQISVPAGAFDCYKISRSNTTIWYSSDAGNIVKSIVDQNDPNMTLQATLTLQTFSRSAQPITVSEDIGPSVVPPGASVAISGQARNTQTSAPIQNANVTIDIPSLNLSWTTTTNTTGWYTKTITAPTMIDDTPSGRETGSGGVIVQCTSGSLSGYRVQTLVTIINTAPSAPSIAGPPKGKPGTAYPYTFVAVDPEDDELFYFIDWGDNTTSGWLGPYGSSTNISVHHTYAAKGTYLIKAKAKDVYGAESGWGTLQVKMPLSNNMMYPPWLQLLERFLEHHPHVFPLLRYFLG